MVLLETKIFGNDLCDLQTGAMWSSCTVLIAGRPFGIGRLLRVYRNVMSEPLACADPVHQVNSKPKSECLI